MQHIFQQPRPSREEDPVLFRRGFASFGDRLFALVLEELLPGDVLCCFIEDMTIQYVLRPRNTCQEVDTGVRDQARA